MVKNIKNIVKNLSIALLISVSITTNAGGTFAAGKTEHTDSQGILLHRTRNEIYKLIENNEGIYFRQICRRLGKRTGVIQHHLSVLEKNGLIRFVKDGRYKCFFVIRKIFNEYRLEDELNTEQIKTREKLVMMMKRKIPKKIIYYLTENYGSEEGTSHQTLAKICGVSAQAITYHCKRLQKRDIIISSKKGRKKFYSLSEQVIEIIAHKG
ncbi:MAG: winged helix-turn-helix transcriptional regulator [Promethearchaeota archaeon]